jgi:two-component system NtrC family sensor kinase
MSLKKKIALSFFISAFIIALLAAFEYFSFVEIRKEIRFLEVTDTVSRKSLQLRRHEKNYFLYSPQGADAEINSVHDYINQLRELLAQNPDIDRSDELRLRSSVNEYDLRFRKITDLAADMTAAFGRYRALQKKNPAFYALVETTFIEHPLHSAEALEKTYQLSRAHPLVSGLRDLDAHIASLRKTGEDILVMSKDIDKVARDKTELVIKVSQIAILIFFPLFFIVGVLMLFLITANVVQRLRLLIDVVERTGSGSYPRLAIPSSHKGKNDEVGVLIEKFNTMEDQLSKHEDELARKNRELIQTRKLAAIGTLAAGVAHELNNPLSNIYLSAQMLARSTGSDASPQAREAVGDILSQSARVKRIVADLLEFARGREPRMETVNLPELINSVWRKLTVDVSHTKFTFEGGEPATEITADPDQMEQVFINLFTNAVEAMPNGGDLCVRINTTGDAVLIAVSDTGKGMIKESLDKVFEPFFTTKDKGTGLGLAIVFNIIRKHYGEIVAASEEGRGTTFTITLPKSV